MSVQLALHNMGVRSFPMGHVTHNDITLCLKCQTSRLTFSEVFTRIVTIEFS